MYLREAGLSIPDDVSVVIFGSPEWAKYSVPQYCMIGPARYEIGTAAAKIRSFLVSGKRRPSDAKKAATLYPCEILPGKSVRRL
jgi:DNA-binding LacI/PurR family transcriptional regulator